MTDYELLRAYVGKQDEGAFGELVRRHMDWVYSMCRRQVGDVALAEDVAQAVFVTLARKAGRLGESVSISGWLFTTARYASATALKIERRRARHERQAAAMKNEISELTSDEAWGGIEPGLNEALGRLSAADREAIILRFFRSMSHEAIAGELAISEAAAQKRVNRAVGRLRKRLGVAGGMVAAPVLVTLLGERSTQAAPAQVAVKSLAALEGGVSGRTELIVKGVAAMKKVFAVKVAAGTMAAVLAAAVTGLALVPHQPVGEPTVPMLAASKAAVMHVPGFDVSAVQIIRGVTTANNGAMLVTMYFNRADQAAVEQVSGAGWSATHLTIGPNEWDYRSGGTLILQKKPMQDASEKLKELDKNLASIQQAPAVREEGSDAMVDGVKCEAYRLLPGSIDVQGGEAKGTLTTEGPLVYVHPETHRPMRVKASNFEVTLAYDPAVPADLFKLPSIAGAQTVNARDYLEKKYPLEGAVFTKKAFGQVFAVHEAIADAAGCYDIVCSSRPNGDARTALNDLPDDKGLCVFMMDPRAKLHFQYIKVGEIRESGMQVSYVMAVPEKGMVGENLCELPVTMGGANELLDAAGLPYGEHSGHDTHFQVRLEVTPKSPPPAAREFAGRAYDEVMPLVGLVPETFFVGPRKDSGISTREQSLAEFDHQMAEALLKMDMAP